MAESQTHDLLLCPLCGGSSIVFPTKPQALHVSHAAVKCGAKPSARWRIRPQTTAAGDLPFEATHSPDDWGGDYQAECIAATIKILSSSQQPIVDDAKRARQRSLSPWTAVN
jgi:hypothetical protein